MEYKLTSPQDKFARLVSEGNTYYDSYHQAYPKSKKWTDNAVYVASSKMMSTPKILLRVQELQTRTEQRNEVTLDQVLTEMASWLLFDPIEMFDSESKVKDIHELPENVRKSIVSFEIEEIWGRVGKDKMQIGEMKKIKLVDKRATADMFMKKMNQYVTKVNVESTDLSHIADILDSIK